MKPFTKNLFKSQEMKSPAGLPIKIHSSIDIDQAGFLEKIIRKTNPKVCLEVGLAFGLSAITVMDAMKLKKGSKFICMDPSQYRDHKDTHALSHGDTYEGMGILNIKRAGYSRIVEFYNDSSQSVLPALASKGIKIDFAFVDGWHTFDHTLVDFFYIDRLLNVGGVVAFHDTYYPSVNALCNFIYLNRNYEIYDHFPTDEFPFGKKTSVMAFKKLSVDDRSWDHFTEFWNYSIFKSLKQRVMVLVKLLFK